MNIRIIDNGTKEQFFILHRQIAPNVGDHIWIKGTEYIVTDKICIYDYNNSENDEVRVWCKLALKGLNEKLM